MAEKVDFDLTLTQHPNLDSGKNAVDILSVNDFLLIEQAFYGTDGFKDGKYLVPHNREMFYDKRRQYSPYVNYVEQIIKAMYTPVFNEPFMRDHKSDIFTIFEKNCSSNNASLNDFIKLCVKYVRMHSVVFIVVDNKKQDDIRRQDAINKNKIPFCYIKKAYEYNKDGTTFDENGDLNSIMFYDHTEYKDNDISKPEYFYRQWNKFSSILYKKEYGKEYATLFNEKYAVQEEVFHNLGIIPVYTAYEVIPENPTKILPEPARYKLVRINHTIFNQDSEGRQAERDQGFSVLTLPQFDGEKKDIIIGTNNYIAYPPDSRNPPQYINCNPDLILALLEKRQAMQQALLEIAEQSGVAGINKSKDAKSGLAYAFEFFAYESTLLDSSNIATKIEQGIVRLFNAWTNENIEYEIKYPKNFKPNKIADLMTQYDTSLEIVGAPKQFKDKIWIEKYKLMFPDDKEGFDKLEKELEEMQEPEFNTDMDTDNDIPTA